MPIPPLTITSADTHDTPKLTITEIIMTDSSILLGSSWPGW